LYPNFWFLLVNLATMFPFLNIFSISLLKLVYGKFSFCNALSWLWLVLKEENSRTWTRNNPNSTWNCLGDWDFRRKIQTLSFYFVADLKNCSKYTNNTAWRKSIWRCFPNFRKMQSLNQCISCHFQIPTCRHFECRLKRNNYFFRMDLYFNLPN
jgi:hypothetical protein